VIGKRAKVNVGVSTFVPKSHTSFQWAPCDDIDKIEIKIDHLRNNLRGQGLKLNWNDPKATQLEAWLSRGDRRMSEVIYNAWKNGTKFDAWDEYFNFEAWMRGFQDSDLKPGFYANRQRPLDEVFPWDHISTSVKKKFLSQDYAWSLEGRTRSDCRDNCFACGILPIHSDLRKAYPGEHWKCPETEENYQTS
jgi:hypothetical protein